MSERLVARPLTDVEMLAITGGIESAETPVDGLVHALKTTFDVLLHDVGSSWDEAESVDGRQFAIPSAQWIAIGEAIKARAALQPLEGVNLLLDWVNKGPSAIAESTGQEVFG